MKILLDENIDVRFKRNFIDKHEVYTIKDMGWTGIKNGVLLKLIADEGFDCWIVVDKNIPFQQNISSISFLLIILDVYRNTLKHIEVLVPKILAVIDGDVSNKLVVIQPDE